MLVTRRALKVSSQSEDYAPFTFQLPTTMNFPYEVPSTSNMHPNLANNEIPNQAFEGVNTVNAIGTPLGEDVVIEAESNVELPLGARSELISNSCPQLMYCLARLPNVVTGH